MYYCIALSDLRSVVSFGLFGLLTYARIQHLAMCAVATMESEAISLSQFCHWKGLSLNSRLRSSSLVR
ncbi:hypothetical protein VNO77_32716 [Canavalia gladiata]|uniref:Uncharacterized protein n=1 Tax=Canavalia gladiata TaxID=3824 RepID=A0AAN9Q4J3_CANGL